MTQSRPSTPLRWLRSTGAVVAGFAVVVLLSIGTDAVLHAAEVYPPEGEPMNDPALNVIALVYRSAFTILGGRVAARLAPVAPMRHVLVLALIGLAAGTAGVVFTAGMDLGPRWYPIALAITGPLFTLLGGWLQTRGGRS